MVRFAGCLTGSLLDLLVHCGSIRDYDQLNGRVAIIVPQWHKYVKIKYYVNVMSWQFMLNDDRKRTHRNLFFLNYCPEF